MSILVPKTPYSISMEWAAASIDHTDTRTLLTGLVLEVSLLPLLLLLQPGLFLPHLLHLGLVVAQVVLRSIRFKGSGWQTSAAVLDLDQSCG